MSSDPYTFVDDLGHPIVDAPRIFDLQVNGYLGVDFNSNSIDIQQLHLACVRLREDGVDSILATVITSEFTEMLLRIRNIVAACEVDPMIQQVIAGIHVEGPFINPADGYIGAHPKTDTLPADVDAMKSIEEAAGGLLKMVTLAPEVDFQCQLTRYLVGQGITVSAGHCNPDSTTLNACIDAGLTSFTHLGNGCPLSLHRHDNIIQRVLAQSDRLAIGWIADGVHVPFPALKNYLAVTGLERSYIVTDAISAAGCGPGTYSLGDRTVHVDDHFATWSQDRKHLIGSAVTMPRVVENLRNELHFSADEIRQLTAINPRKAIGVAIEQDD